MKVFKLILTGTILCFSTIVWSDRPIRAENNLLGSISHLQGKHKGEDVSIDYKITYTNSWGRTIVSGAGVDYYHDRLANGFKTHEDKLYPEKLFGTYPMYYIGTTMGYEILFKNVGNRTYNNLRVVAIQEYLDLEGNVGERIDLNGESVKDWFIKELKSGDEIVLKGSMYIPYNVRAGLDQTHIQVQHWHRNLENTTSAPGAVLIDDVQAAIWCPPEMRP